MGTATATGTRTEAPHWRRLVVRFRNRRNQLICGQLHERLDDSGTCVFDGPTKHLDDVTGDLFDAPVELQAIPDDVHRCVQDHRLIPRLVQEHGGLTDTASMQPVGALPIREVGVDTHRVDKSDGDTEVVCHSPMRRSEDCP